MLSQMQKDAAIKQLEEQIMELEAEMEKNVERIEMTEEIERSASFFLPLFMASLFTIALLMIDKLFAG